MAMYYYARRLQKSASKKSKQAQHVEPACPSPSVTPTPVHQLSTSVVIPSSSKSVVVAAQESSSSKGNGSGLSSSGNNHQQSLPSTMGAASSSLLACSATTVPTPPPLGLPKQEHSKAGSASKLPPATHPGLVVEGGVVVEGTVEALASLLVPGPRSEFSVDPMAMFSLILTLRLWIAPHELLSSIIQQAFSSGCDVATWMVALMKHWTENFPFDFRDQTGLMMANVRLITTKCLQTNPSLKEEVSQVLSSLLGKLRALERYEIKCLELASLSPSANLQLMECEGPLVVAQQLTAIELEKLSYVGCQEFVQAFMKDAKLHTRGSRSYCGVEGYMEHFHRFSMQVTSHIVSRKEPFCGGSPVHFWLQVAVHCIHVGNFNSSMAILTGFQHPVLRNLHKSLGKTERQNLEIIQKKLDASHDFANYRNLVKNGAVVVPFFPLLLKDLYFLKESVMRVDSNNRVSFSSILELGKKVKDIQSWQRQDIPFPLIAGIAQEVYCLPVLSHHVLEMSSSESPPSGADLDGTPTDSLQSLPLPSNSSSGSTRELSPLQNPSWNSAPNYYQLSFINSILDRSTPS